jgi:hypothetical protein
MLKTKHVLIGGGIVTALLAGNYLLNLNRLNNELETNTKVGISKLTLSGLELKVDVTLKNPTAGSLSVKYPFIKMMYGDSSFATSEVRNEDITLEKFSQVQIPPMYINVGFVTLAMTAPAAYAEFRKNGKVNLIVKTISTINNTLPYTRTDNIVLSNLFSSEA